MTSPESVRDTRPPAEAFAARCAGDVMRIEPIDASEFEARFVAPRKPVIIRGLIDAWPAMAKWSQASLRERLADRMVRVIEQGRENFYDVTEERSRRVVDMGFHDLVDALQSGSRRLYLLNGNIWFARTIGARVTTARFPELAGDIERPELVPEDRLFEVNLWMSYDGALTGLHFDPYDNLLCMLGGTKTLRIFEPSETRHLDLEALGRTTNPLHSSVDVLAPDARTHPSFSAATYSIAHLERGDALYMPAGFWHHVHSRGENLGVNFWWKPAHWLLRHLETPMRRPVLWSAWHPVSRWVGARTRSLVR